MRSPVFIVGCPRSGTTWLQRMFASHPDVDMFPRESHAFKANEPDEAVRILTRFWNRHDKLLQMEKTPAHALYIDEILLHFRHAGFVFIHRNPMSVAASWNNTFAGHPPEEGAQKYVETMAAIEPHLQQDYLYRLEYEDLLDDTEATLRSAFAWCGLSTKHLAQCMKADCSDILRKGQKDSWKKELNEKMLTRVQAVLE